jgi:hypothetical protein
VFGRYVKFSSSTPAAAGLTSRPGGKPSHLDGAQLELTRARRDGQSLAAHHDDIRPAVIDIRQDRNVDIERLSDAGPLPSSNLSCTGNWDLP